MVAGEQGVGVRQHRGRRIVRGGLRGTLRVPGHDGGHLKARSGVDQRRVEDAAADAVTEDAHSKIHTGGLYNTVD